jgi:membrane fusion protein, multidrug efflux system
MTTRKRYDMLRERHSISPQEFDEVDSRYKAAVSQTEGARESLNAAQARRLQAMARIEQAQAEIDATRVALGYLTISSPIAGIVTARQADPGVVAVPGMPLITIEDDRTYQLHAVIEESRAGTIQRGKHVSIQIDGMTEPADSRISEIVPASDPSTRTYTVKLDLLLPPQFRGRFHSGFFGRAMFPAGQRQALLAPESALVHRGELTGLYLVQNNKALLRLVKTGKRYDEGVEILSGLDAGARIITKPGTDVTDGVTVIDPGGATP